MDLLSKVEFLKIDRKKYEYRYINGCWPTISYPALNGIAGCTLLLDQEAFDGDIVELELKFLDESLHEDKIKEGDTFDLYVGRVHIAKGEFLVIM